MMFYDPDKVEWQLDETGRVHEAVGLDAPDTATVVQQILPRMVKSTYMYRVYNGECIERLHKFTHIYTAQLKAIEALNEMHRQRERVAIRRLHEEGERDPLIDERLLEMLIEQDAHDAPIIVNNAAEEIGLTVNSTNETSFADHFPRNAEGQPLPPTAEEIALAESRKRRVPKVTKKGETKQPTARKGRTKAKT